jgi:hypothetical protein
MQRAFCSDCGSQRPFRRAFGWGTFFGVLITGGVWLLALPFYPLRCTQCGMTLDEQQAGEAKAAAAAKPVRTIKDWGARDWIEMSLIGALVLAVLVVILIGSR